MPQGAGFSRPPLFMPLWASGSGTPLWCESDKLEPESQSELMGWGCCDPLPTLSAPVAAGWTSCVSLREEWPLHGVCPVKQTQDSAVSLLSLHLQQRLVQP